MKRVLTLLPALLLAGFVVSAQTNPLNWPNAQFRYTATKPGDRFNGLLAQEILRAPHFRLDSFPRYDFSWKGDSLMGALGYRQGDSAMLYYTGYNWRRFVYAVGNGLHLSGDTIKAGDLTTDQDIKWLIQDGVSGVSILPSDRRFYARFAQPSNGGFSEFHLGKNYYDATNRWNIGNFRMGGSDGADSSAYYDVTQGYGNLVLRNAGKVYFSQGKGPLDSTTRLSVGAVPRRDAQSYEVLVMDSVTKEVMRIPSDSFSAGGTVDETLAYFDTDSVPGQTSWFTIERNDGRIDTVKILVTGATTETGGLAPGDTAYLHSQLVESYGRNGTDDSTVLLLKDGTRFAAVDKNTGSGSGSGISSLGQGWGVIIVNDSTYDVDSSLIPTNYYFHQTIDSFFTALDGIFMDSAYTVGDSLEFSKGATTWKVIGGNNDTLVFNWPLYSTPRVGRVQNVYWDSTALSATPQTRLVSGGVVYWIDSLDIGVTAASYYIHSYLPYYSEADSFTLAAADPTDPRTDAVIVNTNSIADVVTGTPSTPAVPAPTDPDTDLLLTNITVEAGATSPSGFTRTILWNEDLGPLAEWTRANGAGLTVSYSGANAYNGAKAIHISAYTTGTRTLTLSYPTTQDRSTQSLLLQFIDLAGDMLSTSNITVRFFMNTTAVTGAYTLGAANGFSKFDNGYQPVAVPLSALAFNSNLFNKIVYTFTNAGPGMDIDYIQLQGGFDPTPSSGLSSFSAGNLSPLFNTSVANPNTAPHLTFTANSVSPYTLYGRDSGTGVPSFLSAIDSNWVTGLHSQAYYDTRYLQNVSLTDTYVGVGNGSNQLSGSNSLTYSGSGLTVHTIANGTAGTDSLLVQSGGVIKKIPADYYGAAGAGITTLNTLTAATQTFAIGTSGSDFNISSVTSTHTFNIPTASASNRGVLSTADWSMFNGKQDAIALTTTGSSGAATFGSNILNIPNYTLAGLGGLSNSLADGKIWVGNASNVATAVTPSGDVTITNAGVTAIGANKVLDAMIRQSAGLSVIGRSANTTGNVADITAGTAWHALRRDGSNVLGFGTLNAASLNPTYSNTYVPQTDGSGNITWVNPTSLPSSGWALAGNAGITAYTNFLGTTDSKSLWIRTNNIVRAIFDSVGFFGVNKAVPTTYLDVVGDNQLPAFGAEQLSASNWTSTNWVLVSGWTYTHTPGNTTALTNTLAGVVGTGYRVLVTVTNRTAGTFTVTFGGVASAAITPSAGTYYIEIPLTATTTGSLSIAPSSTFDGTILISIMAVTGNRTPLVRFANNVASSGIIEFGADTTGSTFVGQNAGARNVSGAGGTTNIAGDNNSGYGYNALALNVSGSQNNAFGSGALGVNVNGYQNVAFGSALGANTSGFYNTGIGNGALANNTTGQYNMGIGALAGTGITTAVDNYIFSNGGGNIGNANTRILIGGRSMSTTLATQSILIDPAASGSYSTGNNNTQTGYQVGQAGGSGTDNSNYGMQAGFRNTGSGGSMFGEGAGSTLATGTQSGNFNTYLGFKVNQKATASTTNTYCTAIGAFVDLPSTSAAGLFNAMNVLYFINGYQTNSNSSTPTATGSVGIGLTTPTARLMLPAGTATANTAPLKLTSGTNLTTAEAGAIEYDGTNLFWSPSTTRHTIFAGLAGSAALDFGSTAAQTSADLTITVTGAADGDAVSLGTPNAAVNANSDFTAWVSAANTVTVRFNNYSTGAIDPASATFKVFVKKN